MSHNKTKIQLGNNTYEVINLTQPLKLDVEVYPGDPKPQRKIFSEIAKTGWEHYIHEIGDHNFQPHADAPNHQNPQFTSKGIETWAEEYTFNKAGLIDLSEANGARNFNGIKYLEEITKKHLEPFENILKNIKAVIIRTGYDKWLENNNPHVPENLPYLNKEAAEYIVSFNQIKVIGLDSITVDPPGVHTAHQIFRDRLIVESMVHLAEIPKDQKGNLYLQTNIIKILGATGGPVVALAWVCKEN